MSFASLSPSTVTITPWSGTDGYGKPTFGTAIEYKARIQAKPTMVRSAAGDEEVSNTQVFIPGQVLVDRKDKITLPEGFGPRNPPIISTAPVFGASKIHHTVVYC